MEEKIKLKKVISKLKEDFRPSEDLIYNKTTKGATIMYPKDKKASMPPKWFKDWYKEFKEYNDAFKYQVFEFMQRQDEFNKNQLEFNKAIIQRLDNVEDKIDYASHRLDNIVTKNNLSE